MSNALAGLGTRIGIIFGLIMLPLLIQWLRGKDLEEQEASADE